jgi:hypothetical protein
MNSNDLSMSASEMAQALPEEVLVQIDAMQRHGLAVEEEALVGVKVMSRTPKR